jgi:hypothetical protein
MPVRTIDRNSIKQDEDWEGNNAAFTCPLCKKVFLVSGLLHGGRRACPNPKCGKSAGWIRGGKASGGTAGSRRLFNQLLSFLDSLDSRDRPTQLAQSFYLPLPIHPFRATSRCRPKFFP